MNKKLLDDLEIDWKTSYEYEEILHNRTKRNNCLWEILNIFIAIGLIVVILSPYIIDYFTK